jgi:nucleophosmin 1
MSFWGLILKAGQKVPVESADGDILHLSQACLHTPKGGKNYLQVTDNEKTYVIACLEKDKVEHASFDLFFSTASCSFSCKGDSEVHLTGYFEPAQDMDDEEEEEEAPPATAKKSPAAPPAKSPKATPAASPKTTPAASPKLQAKAKAAAPEDDEDDDDEGDDEDDEEEEMEMDMEEGEEEEDEDEESEEEPAPPPAKKAKKEAPGAKKEAPAAKKEAPASPKSSAGLEAFVKQVVDLLKKNGGKANISMVGSKCQRPKDAPKLKAILEQNKDKFVMSGDGNSVELKK